MQSPGIILQPRDSDMCLVDKIMYRPITSHSVPVCTCLLILTVSPQHSATSYDPITADTSVNFEILNSSVLEQVTHMSQTDRRKMELG